MIGPLLAIFIALTPPQILDTTSPQVQEECVDYRNLVTYTMLNYDATIFESLTDSRIDNVSSVVRKLTNALDSFKNNPDLYVVLTIKEEPVAMVIPSYQGCVLKPFYMNLEFYKKIRGENV